MPRVRLDWRLTDLDRRTFLHSMELIGQAMTQAGVGQVHLGAGDNDVDWPPQPLQGLRGHHMGTTRMHPDPRQGVVDEQGRIHGVNNLFVAGSSVFPTSGSGTPTLTIVALAIRQADHLRSLLGRPWPAIEPAPASPTDSETTLTTITLAPPQVWGQDVLFLWAVEPASPLYRRTQFSLRFPESINLSRVPERLWWTIALICLHAHWTLLRPCRVRLPIRLDPKEREFWERLLDLEVASLEAQRGRPVPVRQIEIIAEGPVPPPWTPLPASERCATAFSAGKDSLLQAGLLSELTRAPVLVATTSPIAPTMNHETTRRRQVFAEIVRHGDFALVEVASDFRSCWDNGYAHRQGYPWMVQEITDPFLYFAALLAVGVALGIPHLFLGGETEVQETDEFDGRLILLNRFTYCGVTQHALQALLAPLGIRYGSLVAPLHSVQVQQLLRDRYPRLADWQYSCFLMEADEPACNRCRRCFRVAIDLLAAGHSPAPLGIDLVNLFRAMRHWHPKKDYFGPEADWSARWGAYHFDLQVVRNIQKLSVEQVWHAIEASQPDAARRPEAWDAVAAYHDLRRPLLARPLGEPPGYRAGFAYLIDPLLRERTMNVFAEHFSLQPASEYADRINQHEHLIRWLTAPLT